MKVRTFQGTARKGVPPAFHRFLSALCFVTMLGATALPSAAQLPPGPCLEFDTELVTMNLTGGPYPMPLATDPGNALGDSINGYGLVNSLVTITLSSQRPVAPGQRSLGKAIAVNSADPGQHFEQCPPADPVDPNALDGQQFFVNSFFDVFFDITVTDVDVRPGRDIAGLPDGFSVPLRDQGPARMRVIYPILFDKNAPNFGLIPPPQVSPYIGHFLIEIPLPGDINGNGEPDKVKFTLAQHSVGDTNRNFVILPDGTVLDQFDSAAFLQGAVVDQSTDPPFTIGSQDVNGLPDPNDFGGPVTATSRLVTQLVGLDHFLFYKIRPSAQAAPFVPIGPVLLADQFDAANYDVVRNDLLGLPADKNNEGFATALGANGIHLERYRVRRSKGAARFTPRRVEIVNQCNNLQMDVKAPDSLLVPTMKNLLAPPGPVPSDPPLDHFLCYKVKAPALAKRTQVLATTQFDGPNRRYDLKKITKLCNPVGKSGNPVILKGTAAGTPYTLQPATVRNPAAHLVCYLAKLASRAITQNGCGPATPGDAGTAINPAQTAHARVVGFFVNNQLGAQKIDSKKEVELCIPSDKTVIN